MKRTQPLTRMKTLLIGMALWTLLMHATVRAEPDFNRPPDPCVPSGCSVASTSNNCAEGSVILTNAYISPRTIVCVGEGMQVWCVPVKIDGTNIVTTACTNSCGDACTNNCPPPATNPYTPTIISSSWLIGGVTVAPTNYGVCEGQNCLSSSLFVPITCGNGSATFRATWQHVCDTNTSEATLTTNFTVRCPDMTATGVNAFCGDKSGGSFKYCYVCTGGVSYEWHEEVSQTISGCAAGELQTTPGWNLLSSGCWTDEVTALETPANILAACGCTTCTNQNVQTISLRVYGYTNIACVYTNIQTMIIDQASGTVTTTVSGGAVNCSSSTFSAVRSCTF